MIKSAFLESPLELHIFCTDQRPFLLYSYSDIDQENQLANKNNWPRHQVR